MSAHLTGESIMLPRAHWEAAAIEQDKRTTRDPWIAAVVAVGPAAAKYHAHTTEHPADSDDALGVVYSNDAGSHRARASAYVLGHVIGIAPAQQVAEHGKRLRLAMNANGWRGPETFGLAAVASKATNGTCAKPWDE